MTKENLKLNFLRSFSRQDEVKLSDYLQLMIPFYPCPCSQFLIWSSDLAYSFIPAPIPTPGGSPLPAELASCFVRCAYISDGVFHVEIYD